MSLFDKAAFEWSEDELRVGLPLAMQAREEAAARGDSDIAAKLAPLVVVLAEELTGRIALSRETEAVVGPFDVLSTGIYPDDAADQEDGDADNG